MDTPLGTIEQIDGGIKITPTPEPQSPIAPTLSWTDRKQSFGEVDTKHSHDFIQLVHKQTDVDTVILGRKCSCGKSQWFDMGRTDAMRALYIRIIKKENQ